jgi:hypothetical protein
MAAPAHDSPPDDERPVMTVYPSIASLGPGQVLGALYESVPVRIGRVKLSHLLFVLPTSPVALLMYVGMKLFGPRYQLTTHRLRTLKGLSARPDGDVPLDEIGRVEVTSSFGQRFFRSGWITVRDHHGTERLRLAGIVRPEMFRETILETRDSLIRTDAARRTIEARHAPGAGAA